MKTKSDVSTGSEVPNCTYSRLKAEKQTKVKADGGVQRESNSSQCTQELVDNFVQEVIQKARTEYLRQCDNSNDVKNSKSCGSKNDKRKQERENGAVNHDKSSKKAGKDKPKHRHHYKYSDPVDEKEISEYEQQDRDSLLQWNPNFGAVTTDAGKNSTSRNGFHNRVVATFRRLLGCCVGKT